MIRTDDIRQFAVANSNQIDRFLRYKGVFNEEDRQDVQQDFFYTLLSSPAWEKASGMPDTKWQSYLTKTLDNTSKNFLRTIYHHHPDLAPVAQLTDQTTADTIYSRCIVNEFKEFLTNATDKTYTETAMEKIKNGHAFRGSWYRRLLKWRQVWIGNRKSVKDPIRCV